MADLSPLPLPDTTVKSSYVRTPTLTYHTLSAGASPQQQAPKPLILLLHGFPELAFSYRKLIPLLASAGYHVVAFDQRGYGRTTGWDTRPYADVDLKSFSVSTLVADTIRLVYALGYKEVHCIVGHDFGSLPASACALLRPDVFRRCVLMSMPYPGLPQPGFGTYDAVTGESVAESEEERKGREGKIKVLKDLAALPVGGDLGGPKQHYQWYNAGPEAAKDMDLPSGEMETFLRGYFHLKSGDWAGNAPYPLEGWTVEDVAKLPPYYVLPLNKTMPETIADVMSGEDQEEVRRKGTKWLDDEDLAVYASEFSRTGFQGGLNYYRLLTSPDPSFTADLALFAGKQIEVPLVFVGGSQDWATYQSPGVVESMGSRCSDFRGVRLIEGAGHWVMQEKPEEVAGAVLEFLGRTVGNFGRRYLRYIQ
jgi:pimeloyl-ACP methyl ester carboxylesterase